MVEEQQEKYIADEQTPFDFALPKHCKQQEANRVAFMEWEELKMVAQKHNLAICQ